MITITRQEWDEAFETNLAQMYRAMTQSGCPLTPYGKEVAYTRAYEDTLYGFGIIANYVDDTDDELIIIDEI